MVINYAITPHKLDSETNNQYLNRLCHIKEELELTWEELKEFANKSGYKILWQTGKKNFDDVAKKVLEQFEELFKIAF